LFEAAPVGEATGEYEESGALVIFGAIGPMILEETTQDISDPAAIHSTPYPEKARSLTESQRHKPLS
jgi:hypothetical protein